VRAGSRSFAIKPTASSGLGLAFSLAGAGGVWAHKYVLTSASTQVKKHVEDFMSEIADNAANDG
jgi:hypothetical protein